MNSPIAKFTALLGMLVAFSLLRIVTDYAGLFSILPESEDMSSHKAPYNDNDNLHYNFTELVQAHGLAKTFQAPFLPSNKSWCVNTGEVESEWKNGIMYNKMPKAGSTTTSGIVKRIDHRVAARLGKEKQCYSFEEHVPQLNGSGRRFGKRDRSSSFLFSSIRNPLKRAISRMVFSPRLCGIKTKNFKEKLLGVECESHQYGNTDVKRSGFQVAYTIFNVSNEVSVYNETRPDEVGNVDLATSYVRQIMEDYDFMIHVDRFHESIVVMQFLLGLQTSDILYFSAKKTNYTKANWVLYNKVCKKIRKLTVPPEVTELSSKEWYSQNYGDYLLLEATSQSLDLTIDAIGRERFYKALDAFESMKKLIDKECANRVIFPCDGQIEQIEESKKDCYLKEFGCGYPCIDEFETSELNFDASNI